MIVGTTTFSLTPLWRAGADPVAVLERLAASGCGPAVEVIGHQAWRGFPELSTEDERAFRDAVDRLGLTPAALGVYADLFRHPGRALTADEVLAEVRPQLEVAARLGFPVVRLAPVLGPEPLRRVVAEAERLGVVLTVEVQGATPPDAPSIVDVLALREHSPFVGFTVDFSLTTPALPAAFATALRRNGLSDGDVRAVSDAWESGSPVRGHTGEAAVLVAGILGRCGRSRVGDWTHVLPAVHHAHAKFWDPDAGSVRASHGAWLDALRDVDYRGAVVSEWGGHELLGDAEADPVAVSRAHVALLAGIAP